ncbi:MAG: heparan-alpha-glucosaminide N-acetyltransferase domain-containing protein [Pseudoflavonifractor sp.]|nr:heparan-alpha-glucosaminide N-acetyltransferase domain-containing protein [Alloprevotella sp.]MCM1117523.1 heparan-alpha-glucosaminide N-acetyltransferase domain-containing protein [Pseudoflavonifractor sp.]
MKRLKALDIMRGLTIALMIVVNTALWGAPIFHHLGHSLWNGLTAADVVFPFFMFIMGVSMAFSLKRYDYRPSGAAVGKIVRRTLLIFLAGIMLDLAEKGISGAISGLDFSSLRLTGVLARLAFSYGIGALIALALPQRRLSCVIAVFLVGYGALLLLMKGFEPSVDNIVSRVDVSLFGEGHIYHDWTPAGRLPLDPEGFLGLIPSVAHVLIGYLCGRRIMQSKSPADCLAPLLLAGAILTLSGLLLDAACPINKKVWSPTFVMVTCGMAASLLAILIWLLDVKKSSAARALGSPLMVFGINPLLLYIVSGILAALAWRITIGGEELPVWIYHSWLLPIFGPESALPSLIYSMAIAAICWFIGLPLFRHKIYIKL